MKENNSGDFTKNLKKLRMRLGISQESLAEMLDTTHSTVNRWESGQHSPNYKDFLKLMKIFKVSHEELAGTKDLPEETPVVSVSLKEALAVVTQETGIVIKIPKPVHLNKKHEELYLKIEQLNDTQIDLLTKTVAKMLSISNQVQKKKAN